MTTSTTRKRVIGSIAAVGAAALIAIGFTVPSGADFNASKPAHIGISVTTMGILVSDEDNSATIDLPFNNMKPGDVISRTFTVTNNNSFAATGKFGPGVSALTVTGGNPALMNQGDLRVGLWEASVGQVDGLVPVNAQPVGGWDLGVFTPGQSKTFTVTVKLGHGAGNEWQGVTISGDVPVTLSQQ